MNPGLTRPLKVGDKVWCKLYGSGQVIHKGGDLTKYPYLVRFNLDHKIRETFSIEGIHQITKPDSDRDLAGPLQEDWTLEPNKPNESIKTVQTIIVKNKDNGHQEGTIIDIDGCKIFRSGYSMIILPQNDDLWLKLQFSF